MLLVIGVIRTLFDKRLGQRQWHGTVPQCDSNHPAAPFSSLVHRHSSKTALTLIPHGISWRGIEVRAFSEKCQGTSQREKMQQHLGTNAQHSSKNALSLNPMAVVEEGIEGRTFLKICRAWVREKKCLSDGCHIRSTVSCHCLCRSHLSNKAQMGYWRHRTLHK